LGIVLGAALLHDSLAYSLHNVASCLNANVVLFVECQWCHHSQYHHNHNSLASAPAGPALPKHRQT